MLGREFIIGGKFLQKKVGNQQDVNISAEAATLGNIEKTLVDSIVDSK
jgi:hypothetical protein